MSSKEYKIAIVDATGAEKGKRAFTRDAIGCGPRSIYGVLEELKIEAKLFLAEELLIKGFPSGYTSLFISGMSMDKIAIKRLIQNWRKKNNGKVIVGGPITSEGESILGTINANLIVIGEGEITTKELILSGFLDKKGAIENLSNILGIGYTVTNEIKMNELRGYSSLDEFRLFKPSTKCIRNYPNFYSAKVYVECVRGCSNFNATKIKLPDGRKCSNCGYCESNSLNDRKKCPEKILPGCGFCSVPSLFGPVRSRHITQIVKEIEELINYGVKRIVLSAPDFLDFQRGDLRGKNELLINPKYPPPNINKIEELLSAIHSIDKITKGKVWVEVENVKAHFFTEDIARIITKFLPNSTFSIGCETGNEDHARLLGRPSLPKETFAAVKIAKKYNLKAHVYFIHSLPGQTMKTAKDTANLIYKMEPYIDKVTIYRFRPLPMSAFCDFPNPLPSFKNEESNIISDAAKKVNLRKKEQLIGKIVKVILSEPYFSDKSSAMGNILEGGPLVVVSHARDKLGEIAEVKIEKTISEKLVSGRIVRR